MTDISLTSHGGTFDAEVQVPGDKSLSHRALLFAGMAEGDSIVEGLGPGADIASTADALRCLGVDIEDDKVRSPGITGWIQPTEPIDCGNSGTTMRLLAGILSTSHVSATLIGDDSLMSRPMSRLVEPLRALGGVIETSGGTAPLTVGGATDTHAAGIQIGIASAQVRTAFELAALGVEGPSTIDSPVGFRDHTERWLSAIGRGQWRTASAFTVDPGPLPAARYEIPGDTSSAAYLWACAAISKESRVVTRSVSLNPGRLGFLQILDDMGASVEAVVTGATGGDPIGDVTVKGALVVGTLVDGNLVASALDELPLVAVVGAYGEGITGVRDAAELRSKESDRIDAVVDMVRSLDGGIEPRDEGFDVVGTGALGGGVVETRGDHRIAMSAAVAATQADGTVVITGAEVASVSWPGFYGALESLWS